MTVFGLDGMGSQIQKVIEETAKKEGLDEDFAMFDLTPENKMFPDDIMSMSGSIITKSNLCYSFWLDWKENAGYTLRLKSASCEECENYAGFNDAKKDLGLK